MCDKLTKEEAEQAAVFAMKVAKEAYQRDFMELYEALYNILYLLDDHKPISTNHLNTLYDEIQKAQQSPLFKKGGDT